MIKLCALAALSLMVAGPAFAECDVVQGNMVGKAISEATQKDVADLMASSRVPVIDLLTCAGGSRKFEARFRYSQIATGGQILWVEGIAKGKDDKVSDIRYRKSSPQLQALITSPNKMADM